MAPNLAIPNWGTTLCVCVDHLYRCKTSLRFLCGFVMVHDFLFHAGGRGIQSGTTSNEATWLYGIQSLISSAYLLQFSTVYGDRLSQVPACRLNFHFFSALLSQSGITFDQVWMVQLHQNLPLSKDVESILRTEVLVESTNLSCQFCRDCFVHERCTPQQNSQWCFWASVLLIPLSDKVVWALRGRPF